MVSPKTIHIQTTKWTKKVVSVCVSTHMREHTCNNNNKEEGVSLRWGVLEELGVVYLGGAEGRK